MKLQRAKMTLPNKNNTCIVVVTYNPDESFCKNIEMYYGIVDHVIIVDNNSKEDIFKYIHIQDLSKITIIKSHINKGIAWGLNEGLCNAFNRDFDFVLTLDQDSMPVLNILELYSLICQKNDNYGLIGTTFTHCVDAFIENVRTEKKLTLITSGTLHPKTIFLQVGKYKESLFIDSVDFDYSLRVRMSGFDVIRAVTPLLSHNLGCPIRKYGINSTNHPAFRRYYMARNHVYLTKFYFEKFPFWILKKNCFFFLSIVKMIIVESNRKEKLLSTINGVKDGFCFK